MATGEKVGRSKLRRAVLGSVAEQVFNRARVPVMLYHNKLRGIDAARPVVLDGSPDA